MQNGDLNQDGTINSLDLSILVSLWGTNDPTADINGDGTVGSAEIYNMVSSN